jgi:hypothetical protein
MNLSASHEKGCVTQSQPESPEDYSGGRISFLIARRGSVNCEQHFQALQLHLRYLHRPSAVLVRFDSVRGVRIRGRITHCLLALQRA